MNDASSRLTVKTFRLRLQNRIRESCADSSNKTKFVPLGFLTAANIYNKAKKALCAGSLNPSTMFSREIIICRAGTDIAKMH
jgi:hypothetical protein